MYCIMYQLKFTNALAVIYISLFGYNFIFRYCITTKIFQGEKSILSLREKCPNTEIFLVRIFAYLEQKELRILTLITQSE